MALLGSLQRKQEEGKQKTELCGHPVVFAVPELCKKRTGQGKEISSETVVVALGPLRGKNPEKQMSPVLQLEGFDPTQPSEGWSMLREIVSLLPSPKQQAQAVRKLACSLYGQNYRALVLVSEICISMHCSNISVHMQVHGHADVLAPGRRAAGACGFRRDREFEKGKKFCLGLYKRGR